MKQCNICKETKPFIEFDRSKAVADGYQRYCKLCRRNVVSVNHYKKHKAQIINREKAKRKNNVVRYREWKSTFKCCMCLEDEVSCLDFHHLDPSEKEFALSAVIRQYSLKRLKQEALKCIVVCRNCHAKIHANLICVWPNGTMRV